MNSNKLEVEELLKIQPGLVFHDGIIEGEILMKYDYDLAIKSIGFSRGVSAFFFNVTTFLVFILSFVLYNDIKKQIISKQGVKND